ncbi:TIGR04283 family arsenosugar biosynthesis glycosyltransferase [Hydrogenophaga sp.]|uniref:TIGR04283 family arsenosugar biosynthesis glycosyltransferase n=1 Tax=Hydrogenophaga sp. TaxID=1904254 RepID=UPI00271A50CD|nr:TIGR04283 family arsenosugar biosynthesis glycosyltransferase [Hydrogenophaga sp.]MDO8905361.1 TIGR04283 family arsenosugar biosynthesis glycosyltransferase [Hydrogenophaga sp.]
MKLAIVLPVLNEGALLATRLHGLAGLRARGARVVVADGGSHDDTLAIAHPLADAVVSAPRGRAAQMNVGAYVAARIGCDTLLFLHADTVLPPDAGALIQQALARGGGWGRFDVRIEGHHPLLGMVAAFMNARSRLTGIATGDQAVFVQRRLFESLGGFAPITLMEDVELSSRLRRVSPPACLAAHVTTSGRRWDTNGFWRTLGLMWRLRAAYALGADPATLARRYGYHTRAGAAVAVMAKAPVAGLAKTRLIPLLGATGAARAQRRFALQAMATVRHAATGPLTVWCAPDARHRFFRSLQNRRGVACLAQPAGDLGERMSVAMKTHFQDHSRLPLLIVGTDCPALMPSHLQEAADALQAHDAVVIPAEDGGYVLIGLARPLPKVFERVDWSTDRVLAQTRERLREAEANWHEMPTLWDVDEPADWQRWQAIHATGASPTEPEFGPPDHRT